MEDGLGAGESPVVLLRRRLDDLQAETVEKRAYAVVVRRLDSHWTDCDLHAPDPIPAAVGPEERVGPQDLNPGGHAGHHAIDGILFDAAGVHNHLAGSEGRRYLSADSFDGGDGGGQDNVLGPENLLQGSGIVQTGESCRIAVEYSRDPVGGQMAVDQLAEASKTQEANIAGAHGGTL